jgi:hypothetical protein
MSAETAALAVTPHPLGKPGGPGLFGDKALSLPPYVQNIAHSLMEKRGMDKSKAIQVALGTVKNWASGQGAVRPEVRAAATTALAQWEAAKAKAHATPNKVSLSQPMTLLRAVLDGTSAIDLAVPADIAGSAGPKAEKPKAKDKKQKDRPEGKHKLPPGAVGWKHNWVPVDKNGNAVGPSQKDKSAAEIKDMAGHTSATQAAIAQAYHNKATADSKKAATKAASAKKHSAAEAKRAAKAKALAAKRAAHAKEMAKKKAEVAKLRAQKQAAKEKAAKVKAKQKLISDATRQALADKKAGRPLTPTQVRLLDHYEAQQEETKDNLRNNVSLSQENPPVDGSHEVALAFGLGKKEPKAGQRFRHGWIPIGGKDKKASAAEDFDDDLGMPYGEPGTPERAAWVRADTDRYGSGSEVAEMNRRLARLEEYSEKHGAAKEARQQVSQATQQALADKKAGKPLTPSQLRLIAAFEAYQKQNNVSLSQPMASEQVTVPTGSSQDGGRMTVNSLLSKAPRRVLADAAQKAQKKRRTSRRKVGQ